MCREGLWQKLSGSINFYLRNKWGKDLLSSNEELLEDYLINLRGEDPNTYEYLDKKTFEYIKLSDDEIEKVKKSFIERVEKKKIKYADQIEAAKKELENKKENTDFKVLQFKR